MVTNGIGADDSNISKLLKISQQMKTDKSYYAE